MRLNPPITVLTLLVVAFGVLALDRTEEPNTSNDGCEAVIALLKHTLAEKFIKDDGRKLFFVTEPVRSALPIDDHSPTELREEFQRDPFYRLYLQLADLDGVDPRTKCPSLISFLKSDNVRQRFTETQPKKQAPDGQWDAIYVSVSMPVLSEDGREALMLSGLTFGPLAGGGSEVYLRKDKRGEWTVKYKKPTWIS